MYQKLMVPSRGLMLMRMRMRPFILCGITPQSFFVPRHYSSFNTKSDSDSNSNINSKSNSNIDSKSNSKSKSKSNSNSNSNSNSKSNSKSKSIFKSNSTSNTKSDSKSNFKSNISSIGDPIEVSNFIEHATNPTNKSQIYISRTDDPYINLSIEHYLLQKTPADSTVLFLYTNRNSIVIGRNQNPWNEVNLNLLKYSPIGEIDLVRRRSGGGTVFHDSGNVNYCVICPTSHFDRDKHAEMVVRALHKLGAERAIVNPRHDIVLKPTHKTHKDFRVIKISGSAYKLTRERSLHHGTCLLTSPNIEQIFKLLRSPAFRFVTARGVDSVNSTVGNVNVKNKVFEKAVIAEFCEMYGHQEPIIVHANVKSIPEIAKGVEELTSPDWIFSQTPQFTLSTDQSHKFKKDRIVLPKDLPPQFKAVFTARNGVITEADIQYEVDNEMVQIGEILVGKKLHEIEWNRFPQEIAEEPMKWLSKLFAHKKSDWRTDRRRNFDDSQLNG
ncbi:hypothetical protein SBOR_10111 [Sclerotinia borealis F-4128]|uniref:Putative lipoate-protein ligase A n=1 Tax=Sclerotinia borealis (strain F-4128) TaxID=1432307 RepID=W9C4K8_SCLBF|nr:hypothetical protein SBOR_10111 [Sclerotinia borealis F-4128]